MLHWSKAITEQVRAGRQLSGLWCDVIHETIHRSRDLAIDNKEVTMLTLQNLEASRRIIGMERKRAEGLAAKMGYNLNVTAANVTKFLDGLQTFTSPAEAPTRVAETKSFTFAIKRTAGQPQLVIASLGDNGMADTSSKAKKRRSLK